MKNLKITTTEYKERLARFRASLKQQDIDTFILTQEESIYYLTGQTFKSLERLFILVITQDKTLFVIPQMEQSHLHQVVNVDELIVYLEYPAPLGQTWYDKLGFFLSFSNQVALESRSPLEVFEQIKKLTQQVRSSTLLDELRYVKTLKELALIQQACRYCNQALEILERSAYYGMSELEVFSIGNTIQRHIIKDTDFDYLATEVLMAAWPSRISHQAHGIPKVDDSLVDGSHISLAFFRVNGYAAELERTFFTSKPTTEQEQAFAIMLQARKIAYKALRPGIACQEIDAKVREYLTAQGLKEHIMHRTGHGIGLSNHEGPFLALGDSTVLKSNMVVSIEPGIYIEGVGGFRHSDTVQITNTGYKILTQAPDQLKDLIFDKKRYFAALKGLLIRRFYGIGKTRY